MLSFLGPAEPRLERTRRRSVFERFVAVGLFAGAVSVAVPACTLVSNLDALDSETDVVDAGGSDGSAEASICKHAQPPGPPASGDPGGTGEFYFATRAIDFGDTSAGLTGFDLDGSCTCMGEKPTCVEPKPHCDAENGIDNAGSNIFTLLRAALAGVGSANFTTAAEQGKWSTLLHLTGYNGAADDPVVSVEWMVADVINGGAPPAWDGSDHWTITNETFDGATESLQYSDTKAYVSGGVLVAHFPKALMMLPGGTGKFKFRLVEVVISAKIDTKSGKPTLSEGVLAGRWTVTAAFETVSTYRDFGGKAVCTDSSGFAFGKSQVCDSADISSSSSKPAGAACDAFSIGARFNSVAVVAPGDPVAPEPIPPGCDPSIDPANETCPL